MTRALVLGGGGLAGTAWQLGVIAGLAAAGIDLTAADVVFGTSGGATTAAQVTSGQHIERLYQAQLDAAGTSPETVVNPDPPPADFDFAAWKTRSGEAAVRASVGHLALAARTPSEAHRRHLIASRLPAAGWPDRVLRLTAVDAESGEFVIFDRHSGVSLMDAVSASCAVPTVWPPVTINGRRYLDGGVRSVTNADLAAGHDRVVVLCAIPEHSDIPFPTPISAELRRLAGSRVCNIEPDPAALSAIGPNTLDPASRRPSALAGRRQAGTLISAVRACWQD